MYRSLGFPVHQYSTLLAPEAREQAEELARQVPAGEISAYAADGIAVGEHALAGALRFFARADLATEPHGEAVLRRYFHASLLTTFAVKRLVRERGYLAAVFHHGICVPQGLTVEVCRQEGVRVINWNPAYRKRCFIFSHGDTYPDTLMSEPIYNWENITWTPEMEARTLDYLRSRWQGTQDWIWFHERPRVDLSAITAEVGVDFSRPCIGMLTNVMWDAQLHYPANAFPNMREWVMKTIAYFAGRPDLQLLIRIHPAEIRGALPSRQPIAREIRNEFPTLPGNVFVIPPDSDVSTYAAMAQCNAVIIYGTKTGVELTSMSIPVIVAGEAWIRNKGLTSDAASEGDYFALLDRLPLAERLDKDTTRRSRMYAYHFFFRRMIPIEHTTPAAGNPPFRLAVTGLESLAPGRSLGLDVVCDGIIHGTDFIYPAEREVADTVRTS